MTCATLDRLGTSRTTMSRPTFIRIRCLECSTGRLKPKGNRNDAGECPACGYLGWTFALPAA
jgi:hypothetical protein